MKRCHLIFDTETSGFPNNSLPADHPDQAHIVQLACVLLDDSMQEIACFKSLIYPDGWTISPGAQAVHHISQEMCENYGITLEAALVVFNEMLSVSKILIAHNIKFDKQMLEIERQLEYPGELFCTMEASTALCKLPSKIPGKYKWPKLKEAYKLLLGKELGNDAHDALVDCRACVEIYKHLVTNRVAR